MKRHKSFGITDVDAKNRIRALSSANGLKKEKKSCRVIISIQTATVTAGGFLFQHIILNSFVFVRMKFVIFLSFRLLQKRENENSAAVTNTLISHSQKGMDENS